MEEKSGGGVGFSGMRPEGTEEDHTGAFRTAAFGRDLEIILNQFCGCFLLAVVGAWRPSAVLAIDRVRIDAIQRTASNVVAGESVHI